jgi:hypothetical protein
MKANFSIIEDVILDEVISDETLEIDNALDIIAVGEIFNDRIIEVEKYFKFLKEILSDDTYIYFPNKKTHKQKRLDIDTQRILKANGFLVLYNLVESTIKKSISAIYKSLISDGLSYKDIRSELQSVWIHNYYLEFKDSKDSTFKSFMKAILDDVLGNASLRLKLDSKKIPISGNLDARKIKQLSKIYGFSCETRKVTSNGGKLHIVKKQRNSLAHGDTSFAECGGDHSVEDLLKIKTEIISYLKEILTNIKKYIERKEYASAEYHATRKTSLKKQ